MTTSYQDTEIRAAARIIGDISTGVYRSPANALKELVSNAFDAGATEVVINTDFPGFSGVSCYDNGPGISLGKLIEIFQYIGGSDKRIEGQTGPLGRPLIGHIGIGILAMSQLSKRFVIISSVAGESSRIEAEVNIDQFETQKAARTNLGDGEIGHVRIYVLPEAAEEHYTIITTPSGSATLKSNLSPGATPRSHFVDGIRDTDTFEEWVSVVSLMDNPRKLSDYEIFLWEMAAFCPVPYFDDGPVQGWDGWDRIKHRLKGFDFRVIVDGYELRKPVLLPTSNTLSNLGEDYQIYPFSSDQSNDSGPKFQGYIFHQRTQILPSEMQGLLIRIRDVGIGSYDKSWLKYPVNLGPTGSAMTGEVHVETGLEAALNIDRNSFNETHEDYKLLQDVIFRCLGLPKQGGIMRDVRARSAVRQKKVRQDQVSDSLQTTVKRLERASRTGWELREMPSMDAPIIVDDDNGIVWVNLEHATAPKGVAARKEFFRVCLTSRLAEKLPAPDNATDAFVGWLRAL